MNTKKKISWQRLLMLTVLFSFFYVFMEWVFFVTKPSFMSDMSVISKAMVFFSTGGIVAFFSSIVIIVLFAINFLLSRLRLVTGVPAYLAVFLPSAFLSVLALILLDNFTYTVFKFGVVSLPYLLRGVYALGFVLLFFYFARWSLRFICDTKAKSQEQLLILTNVLSFISLLSILGQLQMSPRQESGTASVNKRPNILIIGSDGMNAGNMSVYGYERKTTPFLEQVSTDFLVAENAFTNGKSTKISTVTILTGKLPAQSGIISESSILVGADVYQHLPGILRKLGYYNVQIGVPLQVDSNAVNLQDGFDVVNGRSYDQNPVFRAIRGIGLNEASYFLSTLFDRAASRVLHIFYMREMENPIDAAIHDEHAGLSDREKVAQIIDLIENTPSPLFIQSHLMGTHGPIFNPANHTFSLTTPQDQEWMGEFYDDSILDFDSYIREIMDALSRSGKLENTILVINSDHNLGWRTEQRLPLLIRFPEKEWAGHVKANVQNIDIAPTILDYLGVEKPAWMSGQSFMRQAPAPDRLIQSGDGVNYLRIVQCNRWYRISLADGIWSTDEVLGHTSPCGHFDIANKVDLPKDIRNYLAENGAKIQGLPNNPIYSSLFITREQVAVILFQKKYGVDAALQPAQIIFSDVSSSDPNTYMMERIYLDGIMNECSTSPLSFCPDQIVSRQEAAVYLLKTHDGSDYSPPPAKGIFSDAPVTSPFAPWIEELYARKITSGCVPDPLTYCASGKLFGEHFEVFIKRTFP